MILGSVPLAASPIAAVAASSLATYDVEVAETFSLSEALIVQKFEAVIERLAFGDSVSTTVNFNLPVVETMAFNQIAVLVWNVFVDETLGVNDPVAATYAAMLTVAESLTLSGAYATQMDALNAVAEAIALDDRFARAYRETISETAGFNDIVAHVLTAVNSVTETLALSETAVGIVQVSAVVAETLALGDALSTQASLSVAISEQLPLFVRVRIADDYYSGFCMNAATKGMTEYTNYPFNSFARIGNSYYAAGEAGVFLLEGADDDGAVIEAHIRSGLFRMRNGKLARVPAVYIGYTSDGQLVLKMTTTSDSGQKQEYWYPLVSQTADVAREGRIKVGKGLASVYWQFEIHNKAGADFEIDTLQLHALSLDRRIR